MVTIIIAGELCKQAYNAACSILTRVTVTFIMICLTVDSIESIRTSTCVHVDPILCREELSCIY